MASSELWAASLLQFGSCKFGSTEIYCRSILTAVHLHSLGWSTKDQEPQKEKSRRSDSEWKYTAQIGTACFVRFVFGRSVLWLKNALSRLDYVLFAPCRLLPSVPWRLSHHFIPRPFPPWGPPNSLSACPFRSLHQHIKLHGWVARTWKTQNP